MGKRAIMAGKGGGVRCWLHGCGVGAARRRRGGSKKSAMNAAQSQVRPFVRSRQMGIRGGREAKERCYKEASLAFFPLSGKKGGGRLAPRWRRRVAAAAAAATAAASTGADIAASTGSNGKDRRFSRQTDHVEKGDLAWF